MCSISLGGLLLPIVNGGQLVHYCAQSPWGKSPPERSRLENHRTPTKCRQDAGNSLARSHSRD